MTFEEKVRSMSPYELVMAMVNGLKKEYCKVNMYSYGGVKNDGICYGCAATNAIQEISGVKFTKDNIDYNSSRAKVCGCDEEFLSILEDAYNHLRQGAISNANRCLLRINCKSLPEPKKVLPCMMNFNYKENLQAYINYANEIQ